MKTIIHPGTIQTLKVHAIEGKFALLGDENKQVPLPKIQFPGMAEEGAEVTVFTYFDNERSLVASTQLPVIQVGQVGSFKVKNLNNLGAFIDIGSERDVLIPYPEQREELEEGRWVLVTLQYDDLGQRIFASTKINAYFKNYDVPYERGDEVDMIIGEKLELGRRVIIDGKYVGFLFKQEMLRNYGEGDKAKGYIRKVEGREITVSTQKEGQELIDEAAERILEVLKSNKGYLRLHDDSDPEDIKRYLTMSKKTFKKAAGQLYKDQLITLTDKGIRLGGSGDVQEGDGEVKPLRKRITQVTSERNTVGGTPRRNARDFEDGEMDRPRRSGRSNDDDDFDRPRHNDDGERRPRPSGDRPYRERSESSDRERRPRPSGDRPYRERSESSDRERRPRPSGDRPYRERSESSDRERRPRPSGDRPYRERSESSDRERRPRPSGDRPYRERSESSDRERRPRPSGDRPYRERSESSDRERRPRPSGDRPYRERSESSDRERGSRSYGDRPSGSNRGRSNGDEKEKKKGKSPDKSKRNNPHKGKPKGKARS